MNKKQCIFLFISIQFVLLALSMPLTSGQSSPPIWDESWKYHQELTIPIPLNDSSAYYQPIDLQINFKHPCWTKNVNETSIRVVYWNGYEWKELESQIYNLESNSNTNHISSCNVVFLIPEGSSKNDRFFIYYHDLEKPQPDYIDHVSVEDAYYFDSPIAEIETEAQFYAIRQHGYCIYGVGQEGNLLDRPFSQVVAKQKEESRDFDVFDADLIASFAFSYYYGSNEKDESSSDQLLLDKKIFVDGNLMVEFGILSESKKQDVQTNAIYKYYYCPKAEKRLSVHVRHQLSEDASVQGKVNIDGRFGSIYSIQAKSQKIERLNTGQILPYLFLYGESNTVEVFPMNTNPETKEREWIISYEDDVDIGEEAWFAYGDSDKGNIHALIFDSHQNIIKQGTSERDGIQLKTTVREYIDFLGTEIDYASINFGRNSYEEGYLHDINIPSDLVVDFNAELFSKKTGGYKAAQQEASYFQQLIKYRNVNNEGSFEPKVKTYDLTIHTHLGGTRFSYPLLANFSNRNIPVIFLELYHKGKLVASSTTNRSLFKRSHYTFPELPQGGYLLKVHWKRSDTASYYTAYQPISLTEDTSIHVFSTWERKFHLQFIDQEDTALSNVSVFIIDDEGTIVDEGITDEHGEILLKAPFRFKHPYTLKARYKGILVYQGAVRNQIRSINQQHTIPLYSLTVHVSDTLGFPPGVDINPMLSDAQQQNLFSIRPEIIDTKTFLFTNLPEESYILTLSYGYYQQQRKINITDDTTISLQFLAEYTLQLDIVDAQGHSLDFNNYEIKIERNTERIQTKNPQKIILPPATYTIQVFNDEQIIGIKDVDLTAHRSVTLVTSITSFVPLLILAISILILGAAILLTYLKRLSILTLCQIIIIVLLLVALMQPWWILSGENSQQNAERTSQLFILPQVMIEADTYQEKPYYDIAELPDLFLNLLQQIFYLLIVAAMLMGLSILTAVFNKKNYSTLLILGSVIVLFLTASLFYIGTEKLTTLSLGELNGSDTLTVTINQESISMASSWGLSIGWYLVVISFFISCIILSYYLIDTIQKLFTS